MIAKILISPSIESRKEKIAKILTPMFPNYIKHPDVFYLTADEKLGIEKARKIKEYFSLKPYQAKGRVVVLEEASNLTIEAQNTLLKIIEELPLAATLILGASTDTKFLPTILSRCEIVRILDPRSHPTPTSEVGVVIEKLIEASLTEKFEYIEKLKTREEFLYSLVQYFHQNLRSHLQGGNSDYDFLKELLQAEEWYLRNGNIRAILEYLMLVMPKKS